MREHLFFSFLVVPGVGNVRFYYFSSFPHAGTLIFFRFCLFPGAGTSFFQKSGCSRGRERAFSFIRSPSKGCCTLHQQF